MIIKKMKNLIVEMHAELQKVYNLNKTFLAKLIVCGIIRKEEKYNVEVHAGL